MSSAAAGEITMRTEVRRPTDCSADDLDAFKLLVMSAGEVDPVGFDQRLKSAEGLIFLYGAGEELVGVAAIKRPNQRYKQRVFKKAKSREGPARYLFELGWVVVEINSAEKVSLGLWLRSLSRSSLARTCSLRPEQTISQ